MYNTPGKIKRQAVNYRRNMETRSRNRCCVEKHLSITYSDCVCVALVIQHAMRRSLSLLPYFCPLFHKRRDFRRNVYDHKMCVLIVSTTYTWNIYYCKKIQPDIINVYRYLRKVSLSFCYILIKLEFFQQIFKKCLHIKMSSKSVQ